MKIPQIKQSNLVMITSTIKRHKTARKMSRSLLMFSCFCLTVGLEQYNLIDKIDFFNNFATAAEIVHNSPQSSANQQQAVISSSSSIIKHQQPALQLPKLPKINIYLGRNETKRLLGIENQINYVSEGNIKTYPLGFSIPLGYNQSDMIFTWQNLGQTNVTYAISLSLSNTEAVKTPIINITRNGFIPKQEQVFRISLPCSGKFTNEVDVEIFINISGLVPVEETPSWLNSGAGFDLDSLNLNENDDVDDVDNQSGGSTGEVRVAAATATVAAAGSVAVAATTGGQDPSISTSTSTVTALSGNTTQDKSIIDTLKNQMQSDQSDPDQQQQQQQQQPRIVMKPVSHRLTIKRKKICTMHPVQVQPNTYPPTQPTQRPVLAPTQSSINNNNAKWPPHSAPIDQVITHSTAATTTHQVPAATIEPNAGLSSSLEAPSRNDMTPPTQADFPILMKHGLPVVNQRLSPLAHHQQQQQQQQQQQLRDNHHFNHISAGPTDWPPFAPPPTRPNPTIPDDNPLKDILIRQQQQQQLSSSNQQEQQSFMIPILAFLSVLISLALIVVVIMVAAASGSSSTTFLLNKLNALKSFSLMRQRRSKGAPVSGLARAHHSNVGEKSQLPNVVGHNVMINSLRAGLKSSAASSVSALSAISGHSQLTGKQTYCSSSNSYNNKNGIGGANNSYNNGISHYYQQQHPLTTANSQPSHYHHNYNHNHNHNHHHPPTADLLGTGYQHPQQPQSYPIYHIETTTANPAQTTRLIWQNGNGTSPDGFTMDGSYMPLSNHAPSRSDDNGSAYQTIY